MLCGILGVIGCWYLTLDLVLVRRFSNYRAVPQYNCWAFLAMLFNLLVCLPLLAYVLIGVTGPALLRQLGLVIMVGDGVITLGLLAFTLLTWFLRLLPQPRQADYLIVLGAGLNDGQVPPILAARLDYALACWHQLPNVKVIVTGGTLRGEKISEAQAMGDYLKKRGLPINQLIYEPQALNTWQNLLASRQLIREDWQEKRNPHVAVITNSFHLLRAWNYGRRMHARLKFYAARTPWRYQPLTVIRDYCGILRDHRWFALILLACCLVGVEWWLK